MNRNARALEQRLNKKVFDCGCSIHWDSRGPAAVTVFPPHDFKIAGHSFPSRVKSFMQLHKGYIRADKWVTRT